MPESQKPRRLDVRRGKRTILLVGGERIAFSLETFDGHLSLQVLAPQGSRITTEKKLPDSCNLCIDTNAAADKIRAQSQ